MSVSYRAVQWNRHKVVYDLCAASSVVVFLIAYVVISTVTHTAPNRVIEPVLIMRALGSAAIVLLHVILMIGPLHRLDPRFAPLLYNRRHLGVMMFVLALLHGFVAIGYYGGFGVENPVTAVLAGYAGGTLTGLPFEIMGFAALVIFFLMGATSHDFWLKNLSARWWKTLHMMVYVAYALSVAHVAFGVLQTERSMLLPALMGVGGAVLLALHVCAGIRENSRSAERASSEGWVEVGPAGDIPEGRARVIGIAGGARVAVFREGSAVRALTNVCAHQGGPLGEGAIVDGCVTCPWHGYQFRLEDGCSPPPYAERIETYEVKLEGGVVFVRAEPNEPGTPTQGVTIAGGDR